MLELSPDRSDNWSRRLGEERCARAFPIRSLRETGATVALGSDWPVARFDPRRKGEGASLVLIGMGTELRQKLACTRLVKGTGDPP